MPKLPQPPNDYGLILYSIENNGCLNGVYTNAGVGGVIYNEIAKKIPNSPNGLVGQYDCQYFDLGSRVTNAREFCQLEVQLHPTIAGLFTFEWIDNTNPAAPHSDFEGRGYQMDDKHVVVYYW